MDRLMAAACLLWISTAVGCAHVAPYERGKLAHPTMTDESLDGPAAAHVMAIHEGATGGGPLFGSGCGCN
jgi:hypothetical protein